MATLKDQPRMERRDEPQFRREALQTPQEHCTVCRKRFAPLDHGEYQPSMVTETGRAHVGCHPNGYKFTGTFGIKWNSK